MLEARLAEIGGRHHALPTMPGVIAGRRAHRQPRSGSGPIRGGKNQKRGGKKNFIKISVKLKIISIQPCFI